jgi:D-glycero-D-manno-heptose 1,7-bisphosphate phosphatase
MITQGDVRRVLDPDADAMVVDIPRPRRLLLLDRDGVINTNRGYVHTRTTTEWVTGIFELCRAARTAGFLCVVCTNQAGIARGMYSEEEFVAYTRWMHGVFRQADAPLLATYYCPHHPEAGLRDYRQACECRKPGPAMLIAALQAFDADPHASVLIGDESSDIVAAATADVGTAIRVSSGSLASSMLAIKALVC